MGACRYQCLGVPGWGMEGYNPGDRGYKLKDLCSVTRQTGIFPKTVEKVTYLTTIVPAKRGGGLGECCQSIWGIVPPISDFNDHFPMGHAM